MNFWLWLFKQSSAAAGKAIKFFKGMPAGAIGMRVFSLSGLQAA
jgi:hypothetical protein